MKINEILYGARAHIFINHEGDLRGLARILSNKILQVEFHFDTDAFPPHDETAMCEALGFEVWLKGSKKISGFNYELVLETSHCHSEIMKDKMYDLSPWLERYVREISNIEVTSKLSLS